MLYEILVLSLTTTTTSYILWTRFNAPTLVLPGSVMNCSPGSELPTKREIGAKHPWQTRATTFLWRDHLHQVFQRSHKPSYKWTLFVTNIPTFAYTKARHVSSSATGTDAGKWRICTGPGIKTRHYATEPCVSIATIGPNTRLQHSMRRPPASGFATR